MAREERDREDLLAELTGLSPRIELQVNGLSIVVGYRRGGVSTFYLGQNFSVGFNKQQEVRRLFDHGVLYRAERGRHLTRLDRFRTESESTHWTSAVSPTAQANLLSHLRQKLVDLAQAIDLGTFSIRGAVPAQNAQETLEQVRQTLSAILEGDLQVASGMKLSS